jgi:ABC-type Fe3+/spermidine/putrescine transport system ATPase subunit
VLLDEPFANLDLGLRTQLRGELRRVLAAAGASALLVTHDQAEALTVADRVAVMRRGVVDQLDTPEVIYAQPATPFVATFVGVANLVPASLAGGHAATPLGSIRLSAGPGADPGARAVARGLAVVRPEHVDLEPWIPLRGEGAQEQAHAGPVRARILARRFAGAELHYEVALDDGLRLWVEAGPAARFLGVGDVVALALRPVETVAFASGALGA